MQSPLTDEELKELIEILEEKKHFMRSLHNTYNSSGEKIPTQTEINCDSIITKMKELQSNHWIM